ATAQRLLSHCFLLLQTNHRSQPQIRDAAQAINRHQIEIVDRLPRVTFADSPSAIWQRVESAGGCWVLEQAHGTAGELRGFLQSWAEHAYFGRNQDGTSFADLVARVQLPEAIDDATPDLRPLFAHLKRFRLLTLLRESP